ncbi:MAG: hypothetical protein PHF20_00170 [Halothiobacillaceae bacterium]|nr:hypothetical protein [Halothiobacillaceae bacterium]
MNYPYTQANLLEQPHSYMYTPFKGAALLQSYLAGRMEILRQLHDGEAGRGGLDQVLAASALPEIARLFDGLAHAGSAKFRAYFGTVDDDVLQIAATAPEELAHQAQVLRRMATTDTVKTLELLHALIAVQLTDAGNAGIKFWLDRLVQRFEVTKKLYEAYPSGFRKGEGCNTSVLLYWLFALALSLFYARTGGLNYLSALLKVCDLLCSLPVGTLRQHVPARGLDIVLATEVAGIQLLAESKGVTFAAA